MSKYTELQILKAEEKTLVGILSKLNDQMNRLKVEEMALMSQIRSGKREPEAEPEASTSDAIDMVCESMLETADNKPLPELELGIQRFVLRGSDEEEEEEEEESDDDGDDNESAHDQLTAFLKHLQARS